MLWRQARQLQTFLLLGIFSVPCAAVRTSIIAQTSPAERPDAMSAEPMKNSLVSAENVVRDQQQKKKAKEKSIADAEVNQKAALNEPRPNPVPAS